MYIKSLSISNLRCFEQAALYFQYNGREEGAAPLSNINLLLGNNGAGKTTVLKAIALAILSPIIEGAGYVPYHLIREGTQSAAVEAELMLHKQDIGESATNRPVIERLQTRVLGIRSYERLQGKYKSAAIWEAIYDDELPAFMMVGYGATRRVETADYFNPRSLRKVRRWRYQRVASLFEEHITLIPLSAWLPRVITSQSSRFYEVKALLKELLPSDTHFEGDIEDGEILFSQQGLKLPFSAMSDGYRAYIGWIGDLLYHLVTTCPDELKLVEMRGIVLVDEVDLHLHPEWQGEVVPILSAALPNMQFVLSTHSPIVTGTLSPQNIFIMEAAPFGASLVRQYEEPVYGLNAEQLLLSPYFNLQTSRAPSFDEELREIEQRAWKGDPNAAIEFLKKLAGTSM